MRTDNKKFQIKLYVPDLAVRSIMIIYINYLYVNKGGHLVEKT